MNPPLGIGSQPCREFGKNERQMLLGYLPRFVYYKRVSVWKPNIGQCTIHRFIGWNAGRSKYTEIYTSRFAIFAAVTKCNAPPPFPFQHVMRMCEIKPELVYTWDSTSFVQWHDENLGNNLMYLPIIQYTFKRQLMGKVMPIINAKHIFGTSDIRHIISTDCVTTEQIPLFTLKEEAYIIL